MNYYQKKINELKNELFNVKADLIEVVTNPESVKSIEIKTMVGWKNDLENAVWKGKKQNQ